MDFDGNFEARGHCETQNLCDAILAFPAHRWQADLWRQRAFSSHRATQTIPLLFDRDFRHSDPTPHPAQAELAPLLAEPYGRIASLFGDTGYVVRSLLAKLPAGARIPPHVDEGFSLGNSHRIHVPITTTEHVRFLVGGEERCLAAGEIWEINNLREHQVINRGNMDRVHLIVDWVIPGELRFFRPNPGYRALFRRRAKAQLAFVAGAPPLVRAIGAGGHATELEVDQRYEALATFLAGESRQFTQRDLQTAAPELRPEELNHALEVLIGLDWLDYSHGAPLKCEKHEKPEVP